MWVIYEHGVMDLRSGSFFDWLYRYINHVVYSMPDLYYWVNVINV